MASAIERAQQWLEADPDPSNRMELAELLNGDPAELEARFAGSLAFGTAGLRARMGAGPLRMNRLVVRQAAAGLGRYLLAASGQTDPLVVIGYDARHNSQLFAQDSARVLVAMGVRVALFGREVPTPVVAFTVAERRAAAGIMVTASHNPPGDNGYKVFLPDGSQIVPPVDADIAAEIAAVDPTSVPMVPLRNRLVEILRNDVVEAYVAYAASAVALDRTHADVTVAYTPLHGVGASVLTDVFAKAGLPAPHVVTSQEEPDGDFPTVAFPNPEEPGAIDAVLVLARQIGADLALANDPDADRLGVAIPLRTGDWRMLRGDEIGWLLADHLLRQSNGADRLVVTTLVSSRLLGSIAAAYGVTCIETFTGFKWIAAARRANPDKRFIFGYEQALGYLVADRPADKDGITAALAFVAVARRAKSEGRTIADLLDDISARFGHHVIMERSVHLPPAEGSARVAALTERPPTDLAGHVVTQVTRYPEAGLLRLDCGLDARVQIRPSGTEPKVKIYAEMVGGDPTDLLNATAELLVDQRS